MSRRTLVSSYQRFKNYVHKGGKLANIMAQVNHPNAKGHQWSVPNCFHGFESEQGFRPEEI